MFNKSWKNQKTIFSKIRKQFSQIGKRFLSKIRKWFSSKSVTLKYVIYYTRVWLIPKIFSTCVGIHSHCQVKLYIIQEYFVLLLHMKWVFLSEFDLVTGAKCQNYYTKSSQDKSDNVYKLCRKLIKYIFMNSFIALSFDLHADICIMYLKNILTYQYVKICKNLYG